MKYQNTTKRKKKRETLSWPRDCDLNQFRTLLVRLIDMATAQRKGRRNYAIALLGWSLENTFAFAQISIFTYSAFISTVMKEKLQKKKEKISDLFPD